LAQQVREADALGHEAAAAGRGRERPAEAIVADLSQDKEMLQDVTSSGEALRPACKRSMADHVRATWQVSNRCACRALPVERST
jgi:hypothetical protein